MTEFLTVGSFNIRNGRAFDGRNSWPFRRRATAAAIVALDCDLIGLQEVYAFQLRSVLRRLPGYRAVGDGRDGNGRGEHTPVLTRGTVESHVTRWFDTPGSRFARIATTAHVRIGSDRIAFTSTHLDEDSAARRRASVEQLLAWLADVDGPHVIVGDFNATLDDPMFRAFAAAGFRSALPADAPGTAHHFSGRRDGRRIDHIFVPAGAEVIDARVAHDRPHGRLASDHWPVIARVRL